MRLQRQGSVTLTPSELPGTRLAGLLPRQHLEQAGQRQAAQAGSQDCEDTLELLDRREVKPMLGEPRLALLLPGPR